MMQTHTLIIFRVQAQQPLTINTLFIKKDELKSFYDLLLPRWKGKISMYDPTIGGSSLKLFSVVGAKILNWDYWKEFIRQEPVIVRDQRLMGEWLTSGKYPLAVGIAAEYEILKAAGAPVFAISFKEGTYITAGDGIIGLFKKAPHPNAARVLINWLLSKEGQSLWHKAKLTGSARLDVPRDHLDETAKIDPGQKYFFADSEEFLLSDDEHIKKAQEIFAPLLK